MSYQKHTWVSKEIITATNLNHIESGIYNEEQRALVAEEALSESVNTLNSDSTTAGSVDYKIANAGFVTNTDYATTSTGGVVKVDGSTITISGGVISATAATIDSELSDSSTNAVQNAVITNALDDKVDSSSLATVATTGSYNDLSDTPTIDTVNDATLTIQKNGTSLGTFTANASTDKTINVTVPTTTSELTNDSNFVSSSDLASVATSGSYSDLSNKPTIPTVNNATLTIQKNGASVGTFSANASADSTVNVVVPTKTSDLSNDSGFVESTDLATVATSGSYNDLSNKPTIPSVSGHTITDGTTTYTQRSKLKFVNCTITDDSTNDATTVTANGSTITVDSALSSSSTNPVQNKVITSALGNKADTSSLATVATSGAYSDLSGKPTIPTVNNATLTIQKNGTSVGTFTANASSNATANITVPTKTSELTNDSSYVSSSSLATVATTGNYSDLSGTPTIPTVNNATLTIQKNGTTVKTFTANASSNVTANITVPTKTSELTNDSGYTSNSGTVTSVATGAGLTGGTITGSGTIKCDLKSETKSSLTATAMGSTSSRQYAVGLDANGDLSVNVPWSDTRDFRMGTSRSGATTNVLYFVYS